MLPEESYKVPRRNTPRALDLVWLQILRARRHREPPVFTSKTPACRGWLVAPLHMLAKHLTPDFWLLTSEITSIYVEDPPVVGGL